MKQDVSGWQWHQLHRTQIICMSPRQHLINFLKTRCSSWLPTDSVKALKAAKPEREVRLKYFTASSLKDIFESEDNQDIIY